MKTREVLAELMRIYGENPNSLSAILKNKVKQPQIHKFVNGTTNEPRRSTLTPVAEHYHVPVDVFFDERAAADLLKRLAAGDLPKPLWSALRKTEWAESQGLATNTPATDTDTAKSHQVQQLRPSANAPTLEQSLEILALHINQIPESRRDAAKLLLSALVASPSLHSITAAGIASLCASDTANAAAA